MFNRTFFAVLASGFIAASAGYAENVEIYLVDMLDNTQQGYCVDIAGGKGASANPDNGLQGHTCYSPLGEILVDQAFDSTQFSTGTLYMTEFDVCAQVVGTTAGSAVELASCDDSEAQSFVFSGEGTITPASAPEMCLTVADATRSGRSNVNQIKVLSVETCSADVAAYQTWSNRTAGK